ncbi:MAG: transcription termination factor NusA [candidate division KSB1 bacterium]|nr:transcription termination factor NusA [candidate division KSB1 bacterium]MDZ7303495.1 transcription termination factor NusA [candidate division KSB1 bacterium]MDZ7312703.1 transcription termination factor NusA [candidate division KSB1 bacterium]
MKSEIAEAFSQIVKEKNIDKDQLSEIIHSIVIGMIKKKYGTADNFDIYVNMEKGEIEIHQSKRIVEKVVDPLHEIDLETARKTEPDLEVGDEFLEILQPETFGRRLIISAKQNLNQRIRDEERRIIFDEFQNRVGEIVMGDIRQINRGDVYLNIDRTEAVLPKREQIETEKYRRGENLRAIIKEVRQTSRGPEIIVSRSDPQFLIRLFELEVPEIYDGIIEIKAVARQPGERSKIAVTSSDKRIDPVGACVGMKGIRIQAVSKELNNEKIDVIPWSAEPEIFITRALSPSKPVRVLMDEPNKRAIAVLPDDQVSLAIGRGGQNRRLTGRLTGYEVEIIKESEYRKMVEEQRGKDMPLELIEGLSEAMISKLYAAGLKTVKDVLDQGEEGLLQIKGIGEKTAKKIWSLVKDREASARPVAEKPAEAADSETAIAIETPTAATEPPAELAREPESSSEDQTTVPVESETTAQLEVVEEMQNTESRG